ncbi:MAG: zinc ribbon domain-containing protein [Opitutaceae bacterium]|nr:zinc ribbon domain-containing protein [Opitutaceae bacterium]
MATYVYETIPARAGKRAKRFEIKQSMKDAPLTRHPDTGEPVRRVITGGYGLMGVGEKSTPAPSRSSSHSCCCGGGGCGCHSG